MSKNRFEDPVLWYEATFVLSSVIISIPQAQHRPNFANVK